MMTTLFAYGTLRKDEKNECVIRTHAVYEGTATTVDRFILYAMDEMRYPYLVPPEYWPEMAHKAVQVTGDIFTVTPTGVEAADRLESHPNVYTRTPIRVITPYGEITAETYIYNKNGFEGQMYYDKKYIHIMGGDWKKLDKATAKPNAT